MASLVACFLVFEDCVSSSSIKRRFLGMNFGVRGSSPDSASPAASIGGNSHPPPTPE